MTTAMGLEFINDLRDDTVGQQEWFDYQRARASLAAATAWRPRSTSASTNASTPATVPQGP